jgi:predicted alpha/beta superfamily hydrolase
LIRINVKLLSRVSRLNKSRIMIKVLFLGLFVFPFMITAQPSEISGEGITNKIYRYKNFSSRFVESRNIDVWLPAGYSRNKKYAVLYMHDGQNLFNPNEAFGGVEWNVDEVLQNLIDEKKARDTIVVGIWNTARRVIEYAPQKAFDLENRKNIKNSPLSAKRKSESDDYLRFIVTELKPFVDKNYSTKPSRADTFIMGSSMGALMSLYAVSEYPNIFGGAGCVSTHFPLGEGVMLGYMRKFLPSQKTHKIYFDYGTRTLDASYEPFQKKADAIMIKKGYRKGKNWITRKFDGAEHSEKSWRERVHVPLEFLLGN